MSMYSSFDPYAIGDGRLDYEPVPVPVMEPVIGTETTTTPPQIEEEFVAAFVPVPAPQPEETAARVPSTHRVMGNIRKQETVIRIDDVGEQSAPGKDNSATLVHLHGQKVALVFDHRDIQWESIGWALPKATGIDVKGGRKVYRVGGSIVL